MAEHTIPFTIPVDYSTLVGNVPMIGELFLQSIGILFGTFVVVAACKIILSTIMRPAPPPNTPPQWTADDWPLLGALRFFAQRTEMIHEAVTARSVEKSRSGNFSFFLGEKLVVCAGSAAEARANFVQNKDINLLAGVLDFCNPYVLTRHGALNSTAELLTALPLTRVEIQRFGGFFAKHLAHLLHHENLSRRLHLVQGDARDMCEELRSTCLRSDGSTWSGMNTFDVFYNTIYRMTVHILGADEIVDDPALREYVLSLFNVLDKREPYAKTCFSWLPDPAHCLRIWDGFRLYRVFRKIMQERKHNPSVIHDDGLQYIMDTGASVTDAMGFMLNGLFAGQKSTGVMASWLPVFLSMKPEWKTRAVNEVDAVITRYRSSPDQKPADVLATLPLQVWENDFPLLIESCLRECIRLIMRGVFARKNISGTEVHLPGAINGSKEVIPDGAFAILSPQIVHFDPSIYSDPHTFDPDRYEAHRAEDKKAPYAYLGYGAGRHPCSGMRVAKIEVAIVMAHFLSHFEFDLAADAHGTSTLRVPEMPDFNARFICQPNYPVYLRFKPRPGAF